ncbi:hypothetical protein AORI_0354 [Amycolatopsis keratiniphila]|uniref:Uncharacterized protein n=1 Tax=Amycolatopsis keratiniphila TaxID=129921 RepID=R4SWS3_9PSEU|nr:hypothetical protein AORI_0354 [Amycolatopsis keratiniphila]
MRRDCDPFSPKLPLPVQCSGWRRAGLDRGAADTAAALELVNGRVAGWVPHRPQPGHGKYAIRSELRGHSGHRPAWSEIRDDIHEAFLDLACCQPGQATMAG